MKKILASLVAMAAVIGMIGAGTAAVFTDTHIDDSTEFAAGTVELGVDTDVPVSIENMAPGDSETMCVIVKNDGTLDMIFRMYLTSVSGSGFASQLNATATLNPSDSDCELPDNYTAYGPSNASVFAGTLADLIGPDNAQDNVSATFDDEWPLPPNYAAVYEITVELDFDTGNAYQDASLTGSLRVDGTQAANQEEGSIEW